MLVMMRPMMRMLNMMWLMITMLNMMLGDDYCHFCPSEIQSFCASSSSFYLVIYLLMLANTW